MGRTTVNALIQNGALESVKIGRSRRVPLVCLDAFVNRLRSGDSLAGCEAIVRPMGS
jgi:excisionase family DNA binding protein